MQVDEIPLRGRWENPSNYDIVLNLEYLGIDGACAALLCLVELEQFRVTEDSRKALDDLVLQAAVFAALARDKRTCDADFRIRAKDGVVTIEGMAQLPEMTEAVNEIVAAVEGVTRVVNQVVTFGIPV